MDKAPRFHLTLKKDSRFFCRQGMFFSFGGLAARAKRAFFYPRFSLPPKTRPGQS
jgi:hypothetical protein